MPKNNHMPVVVAGGAGFLGQEVTRYLATTGRRCLMADANPPDRADMQAAAARGEIPLVRVDLLDRAAVTAALEELPPRFHLVNLAAVIEGTTEVTPAARDTLAFHAGAAMNMADLWGERLVSVCYSSSWEVYGVPALLPLRETHETLPFNVYGVGKLLAENLLRVWCRSTGIPLTILRLSHLYGPGEWHNKAIPNFIKNCLAGTPHKLCGGGRDLREPVHTRDVAHAVLLSIEQARPGAAEGVYNIAGGRSLDIREILETVQSVMGTDLPVQELPADRPPLDLAFELSAAKQGLGWEPRIPLEAGIMEEIEWFRPRLGQEGEI